MHKYKGEGNTLMKQLMKTSLAENMLRTSYIPPSISKVKEEIRKFKFNKNIEVTDDPITPHITTVWEKGWLPLTWKASSLNHRKVAT